MTGRYFQIFMGICLITMMYGFDIVTQSETNRTSGNIVRNDYQAALKVDTIQSHQVLGIATRVLQSAANIGENRVDPGVLNSMVRAALDDQRIDTAALVNVDVLAKKIDKQTSRNTGQAMAIDGDIFLGE